MKYITESLEISGEKVSKPQLKEYQITFTKTTGNKIKGPKDKATPLQINSQTR